MPLQAVVLDLDETLLIEYASVERAFRAVCGLAQQWADGQALCADTLYEAVRRTSSELWHAAPARDYALAIGISSWEGLRADFVGDHPALAILREYAPTYRRQTWALALAEQDISDDPLAERLAAVLIREMAPPPRLYPDAVGIVEELRKRYRLALLTNGLPELQQKKIEAAGLGDAIEAVVISGALGVGKPAAAPFMRMLDALRLSAGEAVMVGNSLRADIAGAQGVGMPAIWVRRPDAEITEGITPDIEISTLTQLPEALRSLEQSC
jgi:putative hydrolase of the HAD superfamily